MRSRASRPMRWATSFAGSMNTGSRTRAARVSCQDSSSIEATTRTRVAALLSAWENVEVKACCAPATSATTRETSRPVLERVKNASGMRLT